MSIRAEIQQLLAEGLTVSETARRLGVAGATVEYHIERLRRPSGDPRGAEWPPGAAPTQVGTREEVRRLLSEGYGRNEIARLLGVSRSTVSYHAGRLGEPVDPRGARRYDWEAVQTYYDAGHSVRDCQRHFGFSRQTWSAAVKRGAVVARPHALPMEELLVAGVHRSRFNLKHRLMRSGLKEKACERCGIAEWNGRTLALALHHVNGDRYDNRIENLQLLCPNCHSQTDTFAGRNGHSRPRPSGRTSPG